MSRKALARLYRPRRFSDLATQEHVAETLRSAVARGRVAHAYLFCGPRGVGKTTAARILAMALNCARRAPDGEPCGECESCERIWAGQLSLDVVEIDAASNRGVDDARELRERALYAPTDERRHKVYIVDEAHMLTREAWNALLKILEEPPPRVIFVFATTEPQKIQQAAPPILSRCQRFDFRRIPVPAIVARLRHVLAAEGIEADDEALHLLARRADGALRDALSLLDQVLAFAGTSLRAEDVRRVLGAVDENIYLELFDLVARRAHAEVFPFVARLLDEGYDLAEFQRGLADALRALILARLDRPEAAEVRDDLRPAFAELARRFALGDLLRMLAQVAELDAEGRFRKSTNPRVLLEALLLRFAHLDRTVELEELIRAAAGTDAAAAGDAARRPAGHGTGAAARSRENAPAAAAPADARARPAGAPGQPEPPPASAPAQARDPLVAQVQKILREISESEEDPLPAGARPFLRAAVVTLDGPRRIVLQVPPGLAQETLGSKAARAGVAAALARRLGHDVALEVRPLPNGPARITPESLKNDRLARLGREEPALERAVQAWDLELLD